MSSYSDASTYSKPDIAYMKAHAGDDESSNYIAACAVGITLASIAVALRFASRRMARAPFMADDWLLLVALELVTGFVVADVFAIHYGMGKHIIFVTSFQGLVQSTLAAEIISALSFIPIKLSLLYLYVRLFGSNVFKHVAIGMGAFITLYSLAQVVGLFLQCSPIEALWTGQGTCIDVNLMSTIFSSLNVFTNIALLAIPIPFLWRQKLSVSIRLQLLALFFMGGCVCAFSIIQTVYVSNIITYDPSWNNTNASIWSVIDLCFALVVVCLPTFGSFSSRKASQTCDFKQDLSAEFRESTAPKDLKPDWFKLELDFESANAKDRSDEKPSDEYEKSSVPGMAV